MRENWIVEVARNRFGILISDQIKLGISAVKPLSFSLALTFWKVNNEILSKVVYREQAHPR
jgi:hypothetical protein